MTYAARVFAKIPPKKQSVRPYSASTAVVGRFDHMFTQNRKERIGPASHAIV